MKRILYSVMITFMTIGLATSVFAQTPAKSSTGVKPVDPCQAQKNILAADKKAKKKGKTLKADQAALKTCQDNVKKAKKQAAAAAKPN